MKKIYLLRKLGGNVRKLRKLQRMTQVGLAIAAHVGVTYISRVEHGRQNITVEKLNDISNALHVEINELFV